ncbi:MAG: hypothetical protein K2J33_04810, partial [Alistipes sp.]|nr:hypothetical protein [Alistipes sp.]
MKKFISAILSLTILSSLAACSDSSTGDTPEPGKKDYTLAVSPAAFDGVEAEATTLTLDIDTSAPSWSVVREADNDWALPNISVGVAGRHTVRIAVTANTGAERSTVITVKATGCEEVQVLITQN